MTTVDVNSFIGATHQEQVGTKRIPVPVGDYVGQVGLGDNDIALEAGVSGPNSKNPGTPWKRLDVNITIPDPSGSIKSTTGRDPVVVRMGIMLDLAADGGLDLSTGKNQRLARLVAAAGWPVDGKGNLTPGWSIGSVKGKQIKLSITHRPNPNDSSEVYEEVSKVTTP